MFELTATVPGQVGQASISGLVRPSWPRYRRKHFSVNSSVVDLKKQNNRYLFDLINTSVSTIIASPFPPMEVRFKAFLEQVASVSLHLVKSSLNK